MLKELADIRTILEGLMQPLVMVEMVEPDKRTQDERK